MHRCKTRWTLTIKCLAKIRTLFEEQYPEDLPIALQDEVHIAGGKSSIAYRLQIGGIASGDRLPPNSYLK